MVALARVKGAGAPGLAMRGFQPVKRQNDNGLYDPRLNEAGMYTGEVAPAAGAPDVTAALAAYIGPGVDPSVLQDPEVQAAISKAAVAASKDPEEVNSMVSNTLDALNSEATASPTGVDDAESESEDPLSSSTTADDEELTDTIEPSGTKTGAKSTTTSDDLLPSSGKKASASESNSSDEELGAGFKLSAKFGWVSLASMTAAYFWLS